MNTPEHWLCLGWPLREQARSHSGSSVNAKFVYEDDQMWERACSRRRPQGRCMPMCGIPSSRYSTPTTSNPYRP
ncbi:hypothetical protein C0J56_27910 [Pseudomonas fluorescens]|nr:hypothetical protein C0J56_27910 [Pseudomonas fluorescens]